ncbi:hypothetical protein [Paenibacillus oryzisoli]|uniref:Uncharacterized protein n=1 Tax=Paenibacillus oryzisoli TaxID=1850517 RepID=A0A197ZY70_9BACL|nr:hypothetical protein [Paenibacillus oryzisoli]OAS13736.1 hypothetical protein A8708_25175 [Paenibacillus oryzisoli]
MGNKYEEHFRSRRTFKCPCGESSYHEDHVTYMNDYFNKNCETFCTMDCEKCAIIYSLWFHEWVKKDKLGAYNKSNEEFKVWAENATHQLYSRYIDKIVQFLSSVAKTTWHSKWISFGNSVNSIGTFRKDINRVGVDNYVKSELKRSLNIGILIGTVQWINTFLTEDDIQLISEHDQFKAKLKHLHDQMRNSKFVGRLINSEDI